MKTSCDCCGKGLLLKDLWYFARWNAILCLTCTREWAIGKRSWENLCKGEKTNAR
jgi:hypothetical protein